MSSRAPSDGTTTEHGRSRIGLGTRLQLAFACIALLTVLGAAGAFLLFGRVEAVVGRMVAEQAPRAMEMVDLEGVVRELAAEAPAIANARDGRQLTAIAATLERTVTALKEKLEAAPAAARAELGEAGTRLETIFAELAAQRRRLNADIDALRRDLERLDAAHRETLERLDGLAADRGATPLPGDRDPVLVATVLRAEANGLHALLARAALADRTAELESLRAGFAAAGGTIEEMLATLPATVRDGIATAFASLFAFGDGERDLFERRRDMLETERRLFELARQATGTSKALGELVEKHVEHAREELASAAAAIHAMLTRAGWTLLAAALFVIVLSVFIGWHYVQRRVVRRLDALHRATLAVAEGRCDVDIPTEGEDELAAMGRALAVFREKNAEVERLEGERQRLAAEAEEEKRRTQRALAERLEEEIGAIADQFAGAAEALTAAAHELANSGTEGGEPGKIDLVAKTCRELELTAREIAQQMERARAIGESATADSERSTEAVEELDRAIAEIEEVVTLISDIAEQTNLLALNATIEAARAGDSGRGFAVVASEVKALANQTASATGRIAERIAAIRQNSRGTVEAITTTSTTVHELADVAGAVAAALEQQSAATAAILENVEVAIGSAMEMRRAADRMAADAERLRDEVRSFVGQIEAA